MKTWCLSLFVFVSIIHSVLAQSPLTKPIHIEFREHDLETALTMLVNEAGAQISFNHEIISLPGTYTRIFSGQPLIEVLDYLLDGKQLNFTVVGRQVVIVQTTKELRTFNLSGFIEDISTGERLIGASIYLPNSQKGVVSNAYGFYSLTLAEGVQEIYVSYLGYKTVRQQIDIQKNSTLNFQMSPDAYLSEVLVEDTYESARHPSRPGYHTLDLEQMNALPSLGGETDIVRFSSTQPGVLTGTDGYGGIHVRGGNADQNLFLLDGVPVYSPSHAAGMFSIFNSNAVKSAHFYKGAFPARFGGRLSSVYDIRMKDGNNKAFQADGGLSLLAAKMAIEGPIDEASSSFFISGRRSILDPFLVNATKYINQERNNDGFTRFYFYDTHAKVNFQSGNAHRFYVSLYHGNDRFYKNERRSVAFVNQSISDQSETDLLWGNTIGSFRWNWILSPNLFVNTTVYSSTFKFVLLDYYEYLNIVNNDRYREFDIVRFSSLIQDVGGKIDAEYHFGSGTVVRFGGAMTNHRFQPGIIALDEKSVNTDVLVQDGKIKNLDSLPDIALNKSVESEFYIESSYELKPRLYLNGGVYFNYFSTSQRGYFSVQPRIILQYELSNEMGIGISYGHMSQNLHLLTNSGLGLPTDLWVPVTSNVKPLSSRQIDLHVYYHPTDAFMIRLAGFYKQMESVLNWKEGASFLTNGNVLNGNITSDYWETLITSGDAVAKGIEATIKIAHPVVHTDIGYSLSRTYSQFKDINKGVPFPFRYDRTHVLHFMQQWNLTSSLSGNIYWTYATGNPMVLPKERYEVHSLYYSSPGIVYTDKHEFRMKPYHRLDITLQYKIRQNRYQHTLDIGLYNAYNRLNPLYIRIKQNIYNRDQQELVEVALLPVMPILSYQLSFK